VSRDAAKAAMAEAEAWLRRHGIPHQRKTPHHLKIGDINYYPGKGAITIDGHGARQPDSGLGALGRLLGQRGFMRQRAGGAEAGADATGRHASGVEERQGRAAEQRDNGRCIRQLREEKQEIARERDAARRQREAAERRLAEMTTERDALRAELRKRPPGGAGAHRAEAQHAARAPQGQHGADEKFRAAKRTFAKKFHPDQAVGGTAEKAVREAVFKEFWTELERIERG
jgi:hypothetical protein